MVQIHGGGSGLKVEPLIVLVAALQPLQLLKKVAQNDKPWSRAWKAALLQALIAPPPGTNRMLGIIKEVEDFR